MKINVEFLLEKTQRFTQICSIDIELSAYLKRLKVINDLKEIIGRISYKSVTRVDDSDSVLIPNQILPTMLTDILNQTPRIVNL